MGPIVFTYLDILRGEYKNKNIYCRIQGNIKLYKVKNYKPTYKYEYFLGKQETKFQLCSLI